METQKGQPDGRPSNPRQPANAPAPVPTSMPQLPPQMFTTAASLLDLTDKKLLVALRDGRKLIGILRSWDQYGNLVLQNTIERRFAGNIYADLNHGIYLIRGENIMLMGEIDLDKDDHVPEHYQEASEIEIFEAEREETAKRKKKDTARHRRLKTLGFEGEHSGEALF